MDRRVEKSKTISSKVYPLLLMLSIRCLFRVMVRVKFEFCTIFARYFSREEIANFFESDGAKCWFRLTALIANSSRSVFPASSTPTCIWDALTSSEVMFNLSEPLKTSVIARVKSVEPVITKV